MGQELSELTSKQLITDEVSPASVSPLIVERDGKKLIVLAVTDLDGTVNNELLPEYERIATVAPAIQAVEALEKNGIPVGITTGRSFGEAQVYQDALHGHGPIICEDGAVIILPPVPINAQQERRLTTKGFRPVHHNGRTAVLLSTIDKNDIEEMVEQVQTASQYALISTIHASPEQIQRLAGHATPQEAQLSADRLASAYILNPTADQLKLLKRHADKQQMRTFGTPLHIIGNDADKGHALAMLHEHADLFFPSADVHGILPIGFGNNTNDLKLMEHIHALGGIGVLVGHPNGKYFVPEEQIPDYVIKASAPYGLGMVEAIPRVFQQLNQQFGLALQ